MKKIFIQGIGLVLLLSSCGSESKSDDTVSTFEEENNDASNIEDTYTEDMNSDGVVLNGEELYTYIDAEEWNALAIDFVANYDSEDVFIETDNSSQAIYYSDGFVNITYRYDGNSLSPFYELDLIKTNADADFCDIEIYEYVDGQKQLIVSGQNIPEDTEDFKEDVNSYFDFYYLDIVYEKIDDSGRLYLGTRGNEEENSALKYKFFLDENHNLDMQSLSVEDYNFF